jgi:hypothetical protein
MITSEIGMVVHKQGDGAKVKPRSKVKVNLVTKQCDGKKVRAESGFVVEIGDDQLT